MDTRRLALDLATEHDLHAVAVVVEGDHDAERHARLLAEAVDEVQGLCQAHDWPVWWLERDDDGAVLVVNGLAMDIKQALVELEDEHPLGPWWNLDLITVLPDGKPGEWHRSPMRPEPRQPRPLDRLAPALAELDD